MTAAGVTQDIFLGLIEQVVGADRSRATGALLLAGAHGIAGMAAAGHLGTAKVGVDADQLISLLVDSALSG